VERADLLIMGVCGCGKSVLEGMLAKHPAWAPVDADWLHSPENIAKMKSLKALGDNERRETMEKIVAARHVQAESRRHCALGFSALKRSYRDSLRQPMPKLKLVFLKIGKQEALRRVAERHAAGLSFMPPELVESQFKALEEPQPDEEALVIEVEGKRPEEIARIVCRHFHFA
jgi:gluconokinase